MEEEKSKLENLAEHLKDYLNTRFEIILLKISEKVSGILAELFSSIILVAIFLFVLLFASLAGALAISDYYHKSYTGFLAVSIFYLLLGFILWAKKDKWLKRPIINHLIRQFFKEGKSDE